MRRFGAESTLGARTRREDAAHRGPAFALWPVTARNGVDLWRRVRDGWFDLPGTERESFDQPPGSADPYDLRFCLHTAETDYLAEHRDRGHSRRAPAADGLDGRAERFID